MLNYSHEKALHSQGFSSIAGVDEVGRGPWAGPVVAAAVILNPDDLPLEAKDSKKLSAKKRLSLAKIIHEKAFVSIAEASVEEVDTLNIRQATFLAMRRALDGLKQKADFVYIDGNASIPEIAQPFQTVVKGDNIVLSIACASIVAKVYRDNLMTQLAKQHPFYGWESNAGYGTKAHQEGLKINGITHHHRKSFKPIKAYIEQGSAQ